MTITRNIKPDYLFEVSWEVCNKVGGIHTVVSTKALTLKNLFDDQYILIGPDVWMEIQDNPEFIEDKSILKVWHDKAEAEGLHFRTGRWNIKGSPLVILADFTQYFPLKDKIFADFWMNYQLDSISGQWDYIEPALFGYAAARIIESYYNFYLSAQDKLLAHFHEWMTGMGVLYLKDHVPQAGTLFTTHATVLARSIAGNAMPLYRDLATFQPDQLSNSLGIRAKYSLERISAHAADAFTTVSDTTALECHYFLGRDTDLITPNGFENSFVPVPQEFNQKREAARKMIKKTAEAVLGYGLDDETLFIINSGRYEFRNKGIDLFIDAMWKLNKDPGLKKPLVAFVTVPAHHSGASQKVLFNLGGKKSGTYNEPGFLTHDLFDADHDPVMNRIRTTGLLNLPDDKVKIIFVPAYLNGNDGVIDLSYYDFLIGFDVSAFPSYYEPWGYTPLESLAFRIPSITTSLTGFGTWVRQRSASRETALSVVDRNEDNAVEVVEKISGIIASFSKKSEAEVESLREAASETSKIALWENLISSYLEAYSFALDKVEGRVHLFRDKQMIDYYTLFNTPKTHNPEWKKLFVNLSLPEPLEFLHTLSKNLWWSWNEEAMELFEMIDAELWERSGNNPNIVIENLKYHQIKDLSANQVFLEKMKTVAARFREYMDQASKRPAEKVAYFSMEFGLHDTLKIFSGGLGMLAGDYLKEASDSNANITGIGLLYRYGYFKQSISLFGDQISEMVPQKFSHLPVQPVRNDKDEWVTVSMALPGRNLYAKVWKVEIGRVLLYLLDTDIEENLEPDRSVTHQLYGGDWDNRFKQELLLGVGGIRLLDAIGEKPDLYHCNEGHAAFLGVERLRKLVQDEKLTFEQAVEVVRSTTLFTTHTPVPAGHDAFTEDTLRAYIPHYADRLNISWETFMNLGRMTENRMEEKFSMSVLAAKLSQEINGVSQIHGKVSRRMFQPMYDGYFPEEIHIGSVTNGVHMPTWAASPWKKLFREKTGNLLCQDQSNPEHWKKIRETDDRHLWKIRNELRAQMVDYIKVRLTNDLTRRQENPKITLSIMDKIDENTLTIGFARRFATYKRAQLLFSDLDRLRDLLTHTERPVQLIYAGKAHPNDKAGQDLIKKIIEVSRLPEFQGRLMFIENYDMELAKRLVSGVDIWLNTPTRPLEASGTSGEKASMNGVINLSVLDGWWAEGYKPNAGWALKEARTYANQQFQDELDAETIFNMLEDDIIPLFYERNDQNIPSGWISYIKNTFSEVAPHYTMKRMLDEYYQKYYSKMLQRSKLLAVSGYQLAIQLAAWKKKMFDHFENLEVISVKTPNSTIRPLNIGEAFQAELILDLNSLDVEDVGIEAIFVTKDNDEAKSINHVEEMKLVKTEGKQVTFNCEIPVTQSGVYDFAFRLYPKNPHLPHRQDINLVRWI